jgi:hypothetical protein
MHFLGNPYRNGPEALVPSEQELEERALDQLGRIQAEAIGPLAWAKTLFDLLGMIPGAEVFDLLSGSISAFEGNHGEVALTVAAVAPVGGQISGMSKISDRFRAAAAAFADLSHNSSKLRDFVANAGDAIRQYRKHRQDQLVTVYRGMSEEEYEEILRIGELTSRAQRKGKEDAEPTVLQRYFWHSIDSSKFDTPMVSVTGSVGVARHFAMDGIRKGPVGAIQDLMVRLGLRDPKIADGKVIARIEMRRDLLQRTFHWAQDELLARGGTPIVSIIKVANPELAGHLSYRIFLGAAAQASGGGLVTGSALYYPTYKFTSWLLDAFDTSDDR